jgi:creatinine amidohydrolase
MAWPRAPGRGFRDAAVPYGFNEHHKDFPGVIWIQPETLLAFVTDITKSLAHHGFRRILLLNSHGSNHPVLDLAARKTVIETGIICVSASYWNLCADRINEHRKSEIGGIAHAGEFEAAMYAHANPSTCKSTRRRPRTCTTPQPLFQPRSCQGRRQGAMLMRWWSEVSPDGTMGDPTVADPETGTKFLRAAIEETTALIREIRALPILHARTTTEGGAAMDIDLMMRVYPFFLKAAWVTIQLSVSPCCWASPAARSARRAAVAAARSSAGSARPMSASFAARRR